MIDLHSHILPGLDDGAGNVEESLAMARIAAENGTTIITGTPHSYYLKHDHPGEETEYVKKAYLKLKHAIKESDINIELACGTEIFGEPDIVEKLKDGRLLTLNNTIYPLVEFDFEESERYIFELMEELLNEDYIPVLAHPERYRCFYDDTPALYDLYRMGIVLQVNKGSLFGQFGERAQIVADAMLRHRLAAVAASDAHDTRIRTPGLLNFADYLDENYGDGCSPLLLNENPKAILAGREIYYDSPIPFFE